MNIIIVRLLMYWDFVPIPRSTAYNVVKAFIPIHPGSSTLSGHNKFWSQYQYDMNRQVSKQSRICSRFIDRCSIATFEFSERTNSFRSLQHTNYKLNGLKYTAVIWSMRQHRLLHRRLLKWFDYCWSNDGQYYSFVIVSLLFVIIVLLWVSWISYSSRIVLVEFVEFS